jgi:hypothetical protein
MKALAVLLGVLCVVSLTYSAAAVRQDSAAVGSLAGRVVDSASGQPVGRALVSVSRFWTIQEQRSGIAQVTDAARAATLETAPDGTFTFTGLKPGDYTLSVTRDHYLPQNYGERVAGGRARVITVHAGENVAGAEFRIGRRGAITGRVVAGDGSPKAGIRIHAYRVYNGEGLALYASPDESDFTDAMGGYRLQGLAPGDYYVRAQPPNPQAAGFRGPATFSSGLLSSPPPGQPVEIDIPAYYPGGLDPALASRVHVSGAGEVGGIDFTIRSTKTAVVSGVVTMPPGVAGAALADVSLALVPVNRYMKEHSDSGITVNSDGSFHFNDLIPGAYRLGAGVWDGRNPLSAVKDIDIQAGESVVVALELQPGFEISGRLVAGPSAPPGFRLDEARLSLTPGGFPSLRGIFVSTNTAQMGANGEFVVRHMMPGVLYTIGGNSLGGYVGSARYGDRDALKGIVYEKGPLKLDVEIEFRFGRVEVTVMDQGKPQGNILTLLARGSSGPFKAQESDNQGRVVFSDIWPGDYDLFAIEELRRDSWMARTFWDEFGGRSRRIHVDRAGRVTESIEMIKLDRGLIGK